MVHSYIQKHTNTHRHTKTAKQTVKTVDKTDDIEKTNDYLPNMLLTTSQAYCCNAKGLHSKLNLELCMSVLKLGKPHQFKKHRSDTAVFAITGKMT